MFTIQTVPQRIHFMFLFILIYDFILCMSRYFSRFVLFLQVTDNLVHDVKDTDISIISQEIFDRDPLTRIQNLKVSTCTPLYGNGPRREKTYFRGS